MDLSLEASASATPPVPVSDMTWAENDNFNTGGLSSLGPRVLRLIQVGKFA